MARTDPGILGIECCVTPVDKLYNLLVPIILPGTASQGRNLVEWQSFILLLLHRAANNTTVESSTHILWIKELKFEWIIPHGLTVSFFTLNKKCLAQSCEGIPNNQCDELCNTAPSAELTGHLIPQSWLRYFVINKCICIVKTVLVASL